MTSTHKRRGSADHGVLGGKANPGNFIRRVCGPLPSHCDAPDGTLMSSLRAVSMDYVREEISSHDSMSMELINLIMPEMPKGTSSSLSFTVGDYAVHNMLGRGGSGRVFLGSHLKTGKLVAIKMIDKKRDSDEFKEGISEFKILRTLNHNHIVKVLHAEENDSVVSLVIEYAAKGDLLTHIRKQYYENVRKQQHASRTVLSQAQPLSTSTARRSLFSTTTTTPTTTPTSSPEPKRRRKDTNTHNNHNHNFNINGTPCYPELEAKRLFRQLLCAVHYLHLKGYAHRDIKPENVLVDDKDNVLLCDFSLATTWNPKVARTGSCGTLHFAAPEVLTDGKYIGPEVDIWSCGAVLYFMLSGERPFTAQNDFEVLRNIRKGRRKSLDRKTISKAARNLVDRMMEPNPLKRITMMDILNHDWFKSAIETKSPKKRSPEEKRKRRKDKEISKSLDYLEKVAASGRPRSRSIDNIVRPKKCKLTSSSAPSVPSCLSGSPGKKGSKQPPMSPLCSIQE